MGRRGWGDGVANSRRLQIDTFSPELYLSSKYIVEADSNQKPVHKVRPSDPPRLSGTYRSLTGDSTPPKQTATHLREKGFQYQRSAFPDTLQKILETSFRKGGLFCFSKQTSALANTVELLST